MFALFIIIYSIRSVSNLIKIIPNPKSYYQPGFYRPKPEYINGKIYLILK